jgi:hypothetical protein
MNTIDRLLRACATGVGCRAVINMKVLNGIPRARWSAIARAILELPAIHPRAKERWLNVFVVHAPFLYFLRDDLDLSIALARKVLPPYWGGDLVLYRGQLGADPPGMSWSWVPWVAIRYARFGSACEPWGEIGPEGRNDAVILSALVPAQNIICSVFLGASCHYSTEFVIDPRGVDFVTEPAESAINWIRPYTIQRALQLGADHHVALKLLP